MAKSELQAVVNRWTTIATALRKSGKPDGLWQPLAKQDIGNVLQGRSAMPQAELMDALVASIKQAPNVIHHGDQPSTNPLDFAGNFLGDIGDIAWNFVPGVVHYATSLPQQIQDFVKLAQQDPATQQKYGMETSGGVGAFIRDMSKVPVFGPLIPGLHTAAGLTTEQGRSDLLAHPGFTALDLLPAASKAGEIALAGREVAPLSAAEAFQHGNVVKGVARAAYDIAAHAPSVPDRAILAKFLDNAGLTSETVNKVLRPQAVLTRVGRRDINEFLKTEWVQELGKLPPERQTALADLATHWTVNTPADYFALPANERVIMDSFRDWVQHQKDAHAVDLSTEQGRADYKGAELGMVRGPDGRLHVYPIGSDVAEQFRKAANTVEFLGKKWREVKGAEAKLAERAANVADNVGKVRKFGETDAEFAARTEAPISPDVIHQSMTPLIESFSELDPRQGYKGIGESVMSSQARSAVERDLHLLEGHDGAFAQLDAAFKAGDMKEVRTKLRQINSIFKHPAWEHTPYAKTFRDYMAEIRDEFKGIGDKTRKHGYAAKLYRSQEMRLFREKAKYNAVLNKSNARMAEYLKTLRDTPPATFHPLLDEQLREAVAGNLKATVAAKATMDQQQLQAALRTISETPRFDEMRALVGDEEFKLILNDVVQSWGDLANQGFSPVWMHNTNNASIDYLLHPTILDKYYKPAQFHDAVFNLGRTMNSIYASVVGAESELIRSKIAQEFVDKHLMPRVSYVSDIEPRYRDIARMENPAYVGETLSGAAKRLMEKDYEQFDPARYGLTQWIKNTRGEDMYLPKGIGRSLDLITNEKGLPFIGSRSRLMRAYKYAVLTGPRHMAHVALGGMVFGAVRDPGFLRFLGTAHTLIKEGRIPDELIQSLHNVTDDGLWHYAAGKSIGRMVAEAAGVPGRFMSRLEEHISNTYRVATMLSQESKGLSREAAISEALKTYVDMDNMTAIERTVLKQVFPFYGFTKHLLRYVLTMPVDHPLRVAMLSRLASIEQKDQGDSLPATFNMVFFLGSPDVNGNVTAVDYKSANPFRSMYNSFTLAGVLSSLNPYVASGMEMAGMNVLTATPELYPDLQVDPQTGQLVARRDSLNTAYTGIQAFIPEFSAVDHYLTLTDKMKSLKANNPEAYHRALWSALNMPFAMTQYNLPREMQRLESKRFKQAQNDVSKAMQTNDFSWVRGYNQVPVPTLLKPYLGNAEYATPEQVEAVWSALNAQTPGTVSPKAVLPRRRTRTTRSL